ncbi:MAG: hypothetical protein JWO13_1592 [Acidobacteriales bacterium]|nr:hypothetical protein [Terriglobales bacterium]
MLAYLFVLLAIGARLLIAVGQTSFHFTPIGAALLFFGSRRPRKEMWIPVLLMACTDVALNLFVYHYPVTWETFVSTGWYALAILIGSLLKGDKDTFKLPHVVGASVAGSLSFFAISNLGVWVAFDMYPHTLAGLGACYVAAIPFFRGTFTSDLLYTIVLFGLPVAFETARRMMEADGTAAA